MTRIMSSGKNIMEEQSGMDRLKVRAHIYYSNFSLQNALQRKFLIAIDISFTSANISVKNIDL